MIPMRRPTDIERLYLDFDGFFASVEQQVRPRLRGRPVAVVPFAGATNSCVIAVSREAKLAGVKSVMSIADARAACPSLVIVPQSPDLYRRAHNALLAEISAVIRIDAVKSIDELTCRLDDADRRDPAALVARIKARVRTEIGPWITCSIGMAGNRQLAKMACKAGKWSMDRRHYGDGLTIWHPAEMPEPLLSIPLNDVPGIGRRIATRLAMARIVEMADFLAAPPRQMRAIWRNVTGERLWYAMHGWDVQAEPSQRGMYGHARVLAPEFRTPEAARTTARLLLTKAARRMRRDGWYASGLALYLALVGRSWSEGTELPIVRDDQAVLEALQRLWERARLPPRATVFRVGVTLFDLSPADARQLDFLRDDDGMRRRWEAITDAVDGLNARYGRTVASLGSWPGRAGDMAGGKISYTRIPSAEDYW